MIQTFALRLLPAQDLKEELVLFTQRHTLQAGAIVTAVGSLQRAQLRMAGQQNAHVIAGPLEIVSLVGTLCGDGLHLHLAVADGTGRVLGGHVLTGCLIHTTCEVVILESQQFYFQRHIDPQTTYRELVIRDLL